MTIKKFGRQIGGLNFALKEAVETIDAMKSIVPQVPVLKAAWRVDDSGQGWCIFSVFERQILVRAEVVWGCVEPKAQIAAYVRDYKFDSGCYAWRALNVVIEIAGGMARANEDGEAVSPEWRMFEEILTKLYEEKIVFGPELPA